MEELTPWTLLLGYGGQQAVVSSKLLTLSYIQLCLRPTQVEQSRDAVLWAKTPIRYIVAWSPDLRERSQLSFSQEHRRHLGASEPSRCDLTVPRLRRHGLAFQYEQWFNVIFEAQKSFGTLSMIIYPQKNHGCRKTQVAFLSQH